MRIIAIDIGYGHCKVVYKEKRIKEFKFPTAIAFHKENIYGLDESKAAYNFEGKQYLVGEDAIMNAIDLRDPSMLMKYAPLFLTHAIKLTGINDFDIVSTGISVLNYKYKKTLQENLKSFIVNGERFRFKKVLVSFQGQGVIYDEKVENDNVLVIDGGYLTLDAIHFNRGKINPDGAYATKLGVSRIVEEVQREVMKVTDYEYSMAEINEAMKRGYVMSFGDKIDITKIVQEAVDNYALEFRTTIKGKMAKYLNSVNKIVIAGGLAHLVKNSNNMPKNVIYASHPEYANTRGYFVIAGGSLS